MTTQLSQIIWEQVILTTLVVYVLSFLTAFIVVTIYPGYLGFQARGAPDQDIMTAFADQYAPWIGPISLILFTILGAMWMGRIERSWYTCSSARIGFQGGRMPGQCTAKPQQIFYCYSLPGSVLTPTQYTILQPNSSRKR